MIWLLSFVALVFVLALGYWVWRHLLHRWTWINGLETLFLVTGLPMLFVLALILIGTVMNWSFLNWAMLITIPLVVSFLGAMGFGLSLLFDSKR